MNRIRARGTTLAFEKLAVMAALNISHDLLNVSQQATTMEVDSVRDIRQLEAKIDAVLQGSRQLDF